MSIKLPRDRIITPKELLNYAIFYNEQADVADLATNMGFKLTLNKFLKQDIRCAILSGLDCDSDMKKDDIIKIIAIDNFQSREWIRFEVAYLIALYVLRGNDVDFAVRVTYSDFFKEENLEVVNYASELLLTDNLIRERLLYVDDYWDFEKLKSEVMVPDFILRRKIGKIKEERK